MTCSLSLYLWSGADYIAYTILATNTIRLQGNLTMVRFQNFTKQ